MADWKPPKAGSPVWIGITSNDMARCLSPFPSLSLTFCAKLTTLPQTAHKFYSTVFNWTWKNPEVLDTPPSEDTKPVMVDFNPDVNIAGGISVVQSLPAPKFSPRPGHGGIVIYWLVDDVEATAKVIEEAGGKMMSEARDEGAHAVYRYFEDVDGNLGSIYQMKF